MNCNRAELSFSSHYDGQLSAAERVALDSHLAGCAPCRTAFAEYVRSISDLKKLRPGPTSRQHVADVMARIDLDAAREVEAPRTASWRRAMTHLVAAAIGAAAAVLVLQQMNARESHAPGATPGVVVTPPSNGEIANANDLPRMPGEGEAAASLSRPVRFVGDATSLERNDRLVSVSDGFTLKPGETVRTLPSQSVEITVDENGLLTIKTKTEHVLTPPKAVNEVHFVELPPLVSVDRKLVTDAVDTFGSHVSEQIKALDLSGVRSFVDQIETQIEDSIAATDAREAANEAAAASKPTSPEPEADPSTENGATSASTQTAASAFAPMTFIASEAPVTIQRSGDRSALSVQGSLPRVIPELIALLKNDDGEIADLAAAKLDFVRTDLERSPTIGKRLSPLPAETERVPRERGSRFSELLHTRFGADDTVERRLTPNERWTRWWQANAVLIATGSSSDT